MEDGRFALTLDLQKGYEFLVDFHQEGVPLLLVDEPPPLGEGGGPNPSRLLAAAIANCLSASMLFCLRKARIEVTGMKTTVSAGMTRNAAGRQRVSGVQVRIEPEISEADRPRMRRCTELFEDFCVVTQSVRQGIDVEVDVGLPQA